MLKVGLTGGIGSGKTVVAGVFGVLGIPVFNADAQAKALMEHDAGIRAALVERFGAEIFTGGRLDRTRLAGILFSEPEALSYVTSVVHPAVRASFNGWAEGQSAPYVIMEAAIMAENEGWRRFDRVIAVICPEAERIRRVMARDGMIEEQVLARMRNQASEEQRLSIAHHVVRNDGGELVIPQVIAIDESLNRRT